MQRAVGIRLCDNVAAGGAALLRVRDRLINGNQEGVVLHYQLRRSSGDEKIALLCEYVSSTFAAVYSGVAQPPYLIN